MLHTTEKFVYKGDKCLYSQMMPPLNRRMKGRRLCYLISGICKLIAVPPIAVLTTLQDRVTQGLVIVASFNSIMLLISGLLDVSVYSGTPEKVPVRSDGIVHYSWFHTAFSYRHRLQVIANRMIFLTGAVAGTIGASPPTDDWAYGGRRLKWFEPLALYWLLLYGSVVTLFTLLLWCSWGFRIWSLLGCAKLGFGLALLGIGYRCQMQRRFLQNGVDADFNNLPSPLKNEAVKLFNVYIENAYIGGLCGYGGFLISQIALWTRSKRWIYRDLYFSVLACILLISTFVSGYLQDRIQYIFCHYEAIFPGTPGYPTTSPFADHLCSAITTNSRMNGQRWFTVILILFMGAQCAYGFVILTRRRFQFLEWTIAEDLLLNSLKKQKDVYQ